ncbi:TonB-dependent receptor [Erythrobacter sp. SG61-1L]|uniref:TonB-dependent receptor n=1 Tax=Erythrobacter sp. SG61-1L TaxID=1603897 RepID=UPI0006C91F29|nr:TonB-dependent receptor [Erythrobacter sp. SG61-1L]
MNPLRPTLALAVLMAAVPVSAREVSYSIPAGPLPAAINKFSKASGLQVIADPRLLRGKRTAGLHGKMPLPKALEQLLRGTDLIARQRGGVILIMEVPRAQSRGAAKAPAPRPEPAPVGRAPPPVQPIVVTGQRIADRLAIAAKKNAVNIVDAVSSDDIRRLPDTTIVDALRRVPGVSLVAIADNEHPRDVPIAPVVRGLTQAYNNVTMNGMPMATTGVPDAVSNSASRGGRMDVLPASAVAGLAVVKTFTPDLDPNAIGSAIDMQTRSSLSGNREAFLQGEAGLAGVSQNGEIRSQLPLGGHGSVTAGLTFGPDRNLGVVLSASFGRLDNNSYVHGTSDGNFFAYYDDDGHKVDSRDMSNGIAVPRQDKFWYNESSRQRWSVMAALEAEPDSNTRLSALAGLFRFDDGYARNEIIIGAGDADVLDQTPVSGRYETGTVQAGYREGATRSDVAVMQLAADFNPSLRDRVSIRAGLSTSGLNEAYDMVKFTAGQDENGKAPGTPEFGFSYDTSGFHHSFNLNADNYRDLSLYRPSYWRHRWRRATSSVGTMKGDWRHNAEKGDWGAGFAAGLAWKRTRYAYTYYSEEYRSLDQGLTLADIASISEAPLRYNQSGLNLIVIDPVAAWRMFDANRGSIFAEDETDARLQDNFAHTESILAGYGMLRYADGPWEVLVGARAEQTATVTRANMKTADIWAPVRTQSNYLRVLPSVLANYLATGDLRLRAAYSRTFGRPGFEAYAPNQSVEFSTGADEGNPDSLGVNVSLGNPAIRPRISDNIDLSLEWTPPAEFDGLLSAALFHKQIGSEIFDSVTSGYLLDGIYYRNAQVTQPVNASGAHISGLELSATIGSLGSITPFLAGVGFNGNWTVLRGGMTVPLSSGDTRDMNRLVGQPSEIRNLSIFYNQDGFELRGALNWTGQALRSVTPDDAWQDIYWAPRRQFDLQARYRFRSGISVVLDIANITEERLVSVTGEHRTWLKDSYSVPRTVRLSVNFSLGGSGGEPVKD